MKFFKRKSSKPKGTVASALVPAQAFIINPNLHDSKLDERQFAIMQASEFAVRPPSLSGPLPNQRYMGVQGAPVPPYAMQAPVPPPRTDIYANAPPPASAETSASLPVRDEEIQVQLHSTGVPIATDGTGAMAPNSSASSEQSTPRPPPRSSRQPQSELEHDVDETVANLRTSNLEAGQQADPPDSNGRLPEALAAEAEAETGERDRAAAESAAAASAAAAAAAAAAAEAEAEAAAATRKFQLETIDGPEGERLRRENAILQEAVQRLSARLSNLQAANLVRSGELDRLERKKIAPALPPDGPVPAWIVNAKYLAPLFAAYDQQLLEKDRLIGDMQRALEEFEARLSNVVDENLLLRRQMCITASEGREGSAGLPPLTALTPTLSSMSGAVPENWHELLVQARKVVHENADLMLALERQRRFIDDADNTHKLQLKKSATEAHKLREERDALAQRCNALTDRLAAFEELHAKELELPADMQEAHKQLREAQQTQQKQQTQMRLMAENVLHTGKENKELLVSLAQLKHRFEKSEQRGRVLEELLKRYKEKEQHTLRQLSSILSTVDNTTQQRDGFAHMALLLRNTVRELVQQQAQLAQSIQLQALSGAGSRPQTPIYTLAPGAVAQVNGAPVAVTMAAPGVRVRAMDSGYANDGSSHHSKQQPPGAPEQLYAGEAALPPLVQE